MTKTEAGSLTVGAYVADRYNTAIRGYVAAIWRNRRHGLITVLVESSSVEYRTYDESTIGKLVEVWERSTN